MPRPLFDATNDVLIRRNRRGIDDLYRRPPIGEALLITRKTQFNVDNTTQTLVTGESGWLIRVHACAYMADEEADVDFGSLTGTFYFPLRGGMVMSEAQAGWFDVPDGVDLELTVTGGAAGGVVTWSRITPEQLALEQAKFPA